MIVTRRVRVEALFGWMSRAAGLPADAWLEMGAAEWKRAVDAARAQGRS